MIEAKQCLECGDDIDPRRLKIVPSTMHCVQCIEAGASEDVFAYKAAPIQDEYGNFHTAIVKDKKVWSLLHEDTSPVLDLIKKIPGDVSLQRSNGRTQTQQS